MPRLLIIADDLTGALDSAVAFANRGLLTVVARSPQYLAAAFRQQADIVAVSTGSRELTAIEARERMLEVISVASEFGMNRAPLVFKKVDSRLKGNVAVEVDILAAWLAVTRVVVCPAVPEQGRFVVNGVLQGRGIALPFPVASILSVNSNHAVCTPDGTDKAALDRIIEDIQSEDLLVGAAGAALSLASKLAPEAPMMKPIHLTSPALFVIGSRDPITLEQAHHLRELKQVQWVPAPNGSPKQKIKKTGVVTVLQLTSAETSVSRKEAANTFASAASRLLAHGQKSLLCCGGETADAILTAMGVGTVRLLGQVTDGVPVGLVRYGDVDFIFATKSGGFGSPDCLRHIAEQVDQNSSKTLHLSSD